MTHVFWSYDSDAETSRSSGIIDWQLLLATDSDGMENAFGEISHGTVALVALKTNHRFYGFMALLDSSKH